ncbi:MAG: hypothetical protein WCG78_08855 [Candidatus Omnitrophota bacterium]
MENQEKQQKQIKLLAILVAILVGSFLYVSHMRPKSGVMTRYTTVSFPSPSTPAGAVRSGAGSGGGIFTTASVGSGAQTPAAPGVDEMRPREGGEIKYTGKENRDPFDNEKVKQKKEVIAAVDIRPIVFPDRDFQISALIWDAKRPQAIINNKIVNIGDAVGAGQVTRIEKQGVYLSYEGREVLIPIK